MTTWSGEFVAPPGRNGAKQAQTALHERHSPRTRRYDLNIQVLTRFERERLREGEKAKRGLSAVSTPGETKGVTKGARKTRQRARGGRGDVFLPDTLNITERVIAHGGFVPPGGEYRWT
ncbi:hypothetical protein DFH06DRAFT_1145236 [Mycena polygramma]|nr:hypothetical protein DFH06DRAFT_1145236 [Mycena polygramma]